MNPVNNCPCRKLSKTNESEGQGNPLTFTILKILLFGTRCVNKNGNLYFFSLVIFNILVTLLIKQYSINLNLIFNNIYVFPKGE